MKNMTGPQTVERDTYVAFAINEMLVIQRNVNEGADLGCPRCQRALIKDSRDYVRPVGYLALRCDPCARVAMVRTS